MKRVNLFFLTKQGYGGWLNYTAHLMHAFRAVGVIPLLFKVGNRTELKTRNFHYGEEYRNLSMQNALDVVKDPMYYGLSLITCLERQHHDVGLPLLEAGARIVMHDADELKTLDMCRALDASPQRPITIRPGNLLVKDWGAHYIPHPYKVCPDNEPERKAQHAVAISRICFDKRTEWILEANKKLPKKRQVLLNGFENRLFTRTKILPKFPEYQQSTSHYERESLWAGMKLCGNATFMVDLSDIRNDGGGTQYTFLEAMDAGAIPVLNRAWLKIKGEMKEGVNCLAVDGPKELVSLLKTSLNNSLKMTEDYIARLVKGGEKVLRAHDPKKIGKLYVKELEV